MAAVKTNSYFAWTFAESALEGVLFHDIVYRCVET